MFWGMGLAAQVTWLAIMPLGYGKTGILENPPTMAPSASHYLVKGKKNRHFLKPGEVQTSRISLRTGDYVHVWVEQMGVDAILIFRDPAGREIAVDSGTNHLGRERLWAVAEVDGDHLLEVKAFPDSSGDYEIVWDQHRTATAEDRTRAEFFQMLREAVERRDAAGLDGLNRALAGFRALGDPFLEARTQAEIGWYWDYAGKATEAIEAFEAAARIFQSADRCVWYPVVTNMLGILYPSVGEPEKADRAFAGALEQAEQCGDKFRTAEILNSWGLFFKDRREIQVALSHFKRSLNLFRELQMPPKEAMTLANTAWCYNYLGKTEEARDLLLPALDFWRRLGNKRVEGIILTQLGTAYSVEKKYKRALVFYQRALSLYREIGLEDKAAYILDRIGTAYRFMEQYPRALEMYRQALRIYREQGDRESEATLLSNIGQTHEAMGAFEKARGCLDEAVRIFGELKNDRRKARALFVNARAQYKSGQLQSARILAERALQILEPMRDEIRSRKLGQSFTATRHEYYEFYIDLLVALHEKDPTAGYDRMAFAWSERNKARYLREAFRHGAPEWVDPRVRREEKALRQTINQLEKDRARLAATVTDPRLMRSVEREIRLHLMQRDDLLAKTRPHRETTIEPFTLEEIRRELLDGETLALAYSLGETRSFLWEITRDDFRVHVLPNRQEIRKMGEAFNHAARASKHRAKRGIGRLLGRKMSKMLLGPAAGRLAGKRLLLLPDGVLHYLPFGALPASAESPGLGFLAQEHELVHLPSAAFGVHLRRAQLGRTPAPKTLAVFADPVFAGDDLRLNGGAPLAGDPAAPGLGRGEDLHRATRDLGVGDVPRLTASGREAQAIAQLVPENQRFVALGFDANRDTFLEGDLSRFRYIHFATHGLLHPVHPELSGILLSFRDERGQSRDGFLRTQDLMEYDWSADLITLSACNTAMGADIRGEGMWGLSQVLMTRGAARLLVSLWQVSDHATAELMSRFYRLLLKENYAPAAALKAAQTQMIQQPQWRAPYYWAGFILQGEWHAPRN